jgi:hypothetical protein
MTKSYADTCLERAEKATSGPWEVNSKYDQIWNPSTQEFIGTEDADCPATQFIVHARADVPELARRLKKACEELRLASKAVQAAGLPKVAEVMKEIADELESMPEEK